STDIVKLFGKVPYLNSSLFEPTELEHQTLFINGLEYAETLPFMGTTVLKDRNDKARKGSLNTLDYIFDFLNAYDFSSEGAEEIQEDNKTLINASVLGLIFEKINGYKDGSFFTPGFITMYMCRETIRRAVVQKFNETKNWELKDYSELYDQIKDKKEANTIINSLKICDPAVGSGHFLVSALNEIIAIKSDLKVLMSDDGRTLRDHHIEVVNDELIVTDDNNDLFKYNYLNPNSQTVQRTLFYEKQTIIENCLFGVDINPNSVKICRLRLWIELLKNAYYKTATNGQLELETLPNIDINIKTGNSLISRFALDVDLKQALKKNNIQIETYRNAVDTYRNARDKAQKREMENIINAIKNSFRTEISRNGKEYNDLRKLSGQLQLLISTNQDLFGIKRSKKELELEQRRLEISIEKQEQVIEEIKNNKIYENAFEWRFEFPEVLNNEGDFVGFDVVIGNPPYGAKVHSSEFNYYKEVYYSANYQIDTYVIFIELVHKLISKNSFTALIIPTSWTASVYDVKIRQILVNSRLPYKIVVCEKNTFEDAVVETLILLTDTVNSKEQIEVSSLLSSMLYNLDYSELDKERFYFPIFSDDKDRSLIVKIRGKHNVLSTQFEVVWGIKPYKRNMGTPKQMGEESINRIFHSFTQDSIYHMKLLGGSEIYRYKHYWKGEYLKYGVWLAEPRSISWFNQSDKILVREITSKGNIQATIVKENYVFSNSIDGIRKKTNCLVSLESLLGILNSTLASYFHRHSSANSNKDAFPKVLLKDLKGFPVPDINEQNDKLLSFIVSSVLDQKKINENTSQLENQIDQLIYQLYNLTEEEIKIVEGKS
ncbi:MAG: Eco57I restriction-modification methylase domain-containing protein, partial [Janthinobacterium lividum]